VRVEEKRQPRREVVHIETGIDRGLHVGHAVGQRECHFLQGGASCLAHVVTGDGDGVPLGHVLVGVGEDVRDDAHRLRRRINVGAARDVFLQDIVLHRAG
jgi:hypothetical protein